MPNVLGGAAAPIAKDSRGGESGPSLPPWAHLPPWLQPGNQSDPGGLRGGYPPGIGSFSIDRSAPAPPPFPTPHSALARLIFQGTAHSNRPYPGRSGQSTGPSAYDAAKQANQLVRLAKRGRLDFQPSGGGITAPGHRFAAGGISSVLPPDTYGVLETLDRLGEQRRATPKGPARKTIRKQERQIIGPGR